MNENGQKEDELELSFAKKVLISSQHKPIYQSTAFIPPTSVCVESLFSIAGWIWNDRRASTLPIHVEEQMFLRNFIFWDANTIQKVYYKYKEPADEKIAEDERDDWDEDEDESENAIN